MNVMFKVSFQSSCRCTVVSHVLFLLCGYQEIEQITESISQLSTTRLDH